MRDREWGERVVAAIVGRAGAGAWDAQRIAADLRERLATFKRPRALVFVDRLPVTSLGKPDRAETARLYAGHLKDVAYRD